MKLFGCRIAYFFAVVLLVLVCFLDFELGSSFNVEGNPLYGVRKRADLEFCLDLFVFQISIRCAGRRVLGFREEPEVDPHGLVSNRRVKVEEDHDRRSPVRVLSIDGRVVSLKYGNRNIRERLQTNIREKKIFWSGNNRKLRALYPADQTLFVKFRQGTSISSESPSVPKTSPSPYSSEVDYGKKYPPDNLATSTSAPSLPPVPPPPVPPPKANGTSPSYYSAPPLFKESPPDPRIQTATSNKQTLLIVIGVVTGAVLMVLAVILAVFCRNKKVVDIKPQIKEGLSGQLRKALVTGVPSLNHSELESACEVFSNEIGSLSDGKLYKGTLAAGAEIAVNVIELGRNWARHHEDQFKKKISTMSKVNHKNFVNLIGYCEEEEPRSRMMVFEYASNGTLFEHLHAKEEDSNSLTWPQRSRIAMGAAYCVAHMHRLDPPVILQNLNSSSIFLTDDFAAKIADMELQSQTTCIKTNPRNPGILLEEQMQKQQSLVHKYGTLLLELISGRPPNSDESGGLVNWALDHLKGTKPLEEILDPTLTSFPADKLRSICHVIESCLNPDLKRRPSMQDVTAQLREITGVTPDAAAPRLSPPWWTELEMVSLAVHPKTE